MFRVRVMVGVRVWLGLRLFFVRVWVSVRFKVWFSFRVRVMVHFMFGVRV